MWNSPQSIAMWGAPVACPTGMTCVGDTYAGIIKTCVTEKVSRCVAPGLNWHLLALGFIFAAFDAFGIGSNDVANAFATSVGSGSLSLRQAMGIAFFTEIIGAVFLGAAVTDTIKGSIVNLGAFKNQPDVLMLGMVCAVIASSFWVNAASYLGYPVSTTHAIVGAMIGIGMAFRGNISTKWPVPGQPFITEDPVNLLKFESLGGILLSFGLSPAIAAVFGAVLFAIIKYLVFWRKDHSYRYALWTSPIFVFGTWLLIAFFMVFKGAPALKLDKIDIGTVVGVAFAVGAGAGLVVLVFGIPFLKRQIEGKPLPTIWGIEFERIPLYFKMELPEPVKADDMPYMEWLKAYNEKKAADAKAAELEAAEEHKTADPTGYAAKVAQDEQNAADLIAVKPSAGSYMMAMGHKALKALTWGVDKEVRSHDLGNQPWHAEAEKHDERAERVYGYLQVMTAAFASLSHGGNDVSNAIAPFCVIIEIFNSGFNNLANSKASKVPVPVWVLAYGGAWISIGLFFAGFVIMRSLGNNLTYHSPSRGFCMELGALTTVLAATKLGLPVSTTHCITGSTVGVGLMNGNLKAVNWKMFAIASLGWVVTLPITAICSAVLFMFVAYSPHKLEQSMLPTIVQCYDQSCLQITQQPTN